MFIRVHFLFYCWNWVSLFGKLEIKKKKSMSLSNHGRSLPNHVFILPNLVRTQCSFFSSVSKFVPSMNLADE